MPVTKTRSVRKRTPADAPLVDSVYQALLEKIVSGDLASGTVVSELALAGELGVSRTPVHDAVRQLAKDGLVVRTGRSRARIASFGPDDVYEIFEMRKILEGPAAELAAGRMDRRHFATLRGAAEQLAACPPGDRWVARWADFDEMFHRTIAQASGNRRLAKDIASYHLLHKGLNRISTDRDTLKRAMAEHLAILDALEARDGLLARQRMIDHITVWQDFFFNSISPDPAGPRRKGRR